ncbi:MAG: phosphoribosylformylglycinamidine cyclo-ligase [Acidobacteriota bacterium]|nr:phosphoribosylformylglycinamidine cyclo-ligase [Acidobacteriota bacterium]
MSDTTDDFPQEMQERGKPGTIAKLSHAGSNTAAKRSRAATPYASTGNDAASVAKERIALLARRSFNKNVLSEIGGFNGLFALDAERYPDPVLVSSADGVGAKLKVAAATGLHQNVGSDLVNHCVNDIAVQGATPLFFLDSFASGKLDPDVVERVVSGIVDACKANGCALLGGETSELPGVYVGAEYDLAGFIVGVVSRARLITGDAIKAGDVLIGLPSNGLHTSGYTLARKLLFDDADYTHDQYVNELKDKVGAALMRAHRSYLSPIRKLIQAEVASGFAHITGGGITGNLPRVLPRGLCAHVELTSWEPQPIFTHLQSLGKIDQEEMLRTFNMGIGMVAIVPAERLAKARLILNRMNERHFVIGRVVKGERKVIYG